jgi:ATP-binding cassette subfamily F protein 3
MALRLQAAARGGDQVLAAEGVRVAIGERVLVEGFSTTVRRGDIVGLIGPNGAGKTTLARALIGETPLDGGTVRIPHSVQIAHYRQDLAQVPGGHSLYQIISDLRPAWGRGAIQDHLGRFGFSGDSVLRKADTLSGGERARVALAVMMLSGANLLLFDEPTNHLDVESIEALEDALEGYDGTVILISHDRALLRALTSRVWVLHERRITDFPGGFDEWEMVSAERAHAAAVMAAEEEALRRMHERQQIRRADERKKQDASLKRATRRVLEEAESRVSACEARVNGIRARLEDPSLYATEAGVLEARALGKELDAARAELDSAYKEWEVASEEDGGTAGGR